MDKTEGISGILKPNAHPKCNLLELTLSVYFLVRVTWSGKEGGGG